MHHNFYIIEGQIEYFIHIWCIQVSVSPYDYNFDSLVWYCGTCVWDSKCLENEGDTEIII